MVGYIKDDIMTSNQKLIAGCVSGVVTRFLTQPLDVIKIRTQLQRKTSRRKHRSVYETSKKVFHEEGITAFWHGHNLGQVHSILSASCQFYVYEVLSQYAFSFSINPKYQNILDFSCGLCAGCCTATLVSPIEVIRVRQMLVKEQYRGLLNGARAVYMSGGIFAFYEGLSASVLMLGPQVGITFAVYGFIQPVIINYLRKAGEVETHSRIQAEHLLVASTFAALISGFVAKVTMYPFDLAKRRLQIASHREENKYFTPTTSRNLVKCVNLVQCITDTVKAEGFLGLYRGLKVTIYKAVSQNLITFTTYEMTCYCIREFKKR
ncbi:mitochondrial thiamine pyrophosphate carrier-like [Leptidea sinapis]|uniref:mitochondrial thiamine pyrophosphate carrier-like n=1 Tax=Leptidea sinapis TaxID=189913 RepID=UPI0021385D7F|nr:mitochondrial thiamine pyrophosphate carrier-like [Leptidea sinapis]